MRSPESVRSTRDSSSLVVSEPELVEPLGLGRADVARGGPALRIGVLVMPDQGLPVLVARALHGGSNV